MPCNTSPSDRRRHNSNNPFPCRHQAGVTRGPLPGSDKLSVCPVPGRPPSVKSCRTTLDSGKLRASSATHEQRVRCTASLCRPFWAHKHTQGCCSALRPSTRGARQLLGSTGIVAFSRLVALQSSLCDRCSQGVDIDAARLKPWKNEPCPNKGLLWKHDLRSCVSAPQANGGCPLSAPQCCQAKKPFRAGPRSVPVGEAKTDGSRRFARTNPSNRPTFSVRVITLYLRSRCHRAAYGLTVHVVFRCTAMGSRGSPASVSRLWNHRDLTPTA